MLAFVYGTRPEAIKLGPIAAELRSLGLSPLILCTGQHQSLLSGTPAESDLADGRSLGLGTSPEVWKWVEAAVPEIKRALERERASVVVVQGDTMSAFAGAKAGFSLGLPVVHVEAGLRSGDLREPWPEEGIRRRISLLATWHLAPTDYTRQNLLREGIPEGAIRVTGNPVVSAIARYSDARPRLVPDPHILFTMHRREWLLQGEEHVRATIREVGNEMWGGGVRIVWPMHPGVRKIAGEAWLQAVEEDTGVEIVEPMRYRETLNVLSRAIGVATDSGGLTEEAATLGVPCVMLRNVTDRPESVDAGIARLVSPSPEGVREALSALLGREIPRRAVSVYGNPDAAARIARFLAEIPAEAPKQPLKMAA
jgi:UDP-N-acetylglucosamine 2-epimerase (non-hydrolysing)